MEGIVARLMKDKNFGFIRSGNKDYFFHASGLKNIKFTELEEGQKVEFEETETTKGLRAEEIYA